MNIIGTKSGKEVCQGWQPLQKLSDSSERNRPKGRVEATGVGRRNRCEEEKKMGRESHGFGGPPL